MIFIENQPLVDNRALKMKEQHGPKAVLINKSTRGKKKERGEKEKEEKRMNLVFIITTHTPTNSCVNGKVPPAD
jgi:hypothetical protein